MSTDFTDLENYTTFGSGEVPMLSHLKFKSELGFGDIIGHLIIWLILSIVTLGFALMLFPYYIMRFVLNNTYVYDQRDGKKLACLHCDVQLTGILGNALIWFLLSFITFGLAYLFYIYRIHGFCYSKTKIVNL